MLQQFLTDLENGIAPKACSDHKNIVWKQIRAFEAASGKLMKDGFTRQEYLNLFNSMSLRSAGYFQNRRSAVIAYVKYLIEKGVLPPEHVELVQGIDFSELENRNADGTQMVYYHNLTQLEAAIQESLEESDSYDKTHFDMAICALYLAWFGFDRKEIPEIKKADVQKNGVLRKGELVAMPDFVCDVLQRYCHSEGYDQKARYIITRKYLPSAYLFRTFRAAQIDDKMLRQAISRLNTVLQGTFSLEYELVRKSGILHRVYQREKAGELGKLTELQYDWQLVEDVFENAIETREHAVKWLADYERFKKANCG